MTWNTFFPYPQRALVSSIIAGIFIYFRRLDYYATMPRSSVLVSLLVFAWAYLNYMEPIALPLGLILLNLFGNKHVVGFEESIGGSRGQVWGPGTNLLGGSKGFQSGWRV